VRRPVSGYVGCAASPAELHTETESSATTMETGHGAFTEYWQAVSAADERVARLSRALPSAIDCRLALRVGGAGAAGPARH
jgi:hypothetical protein